MPRVPRPTVPGSLATTVRLLALALVASCGGGGGGTGPAPEPVATVEIAQVNPTVKAGTTLQLIATTKDKNGTALTGRTVTWSIPTTVAAFSLSPGGMVTGLDAGSGVVTATSEGKTAQTTVTVTVEPVASVTLTPDSARSGATLVVGDQLPLTVTLKDAAGTTLTDRPVTFATSNQGLASVSTAGVITAAAEGGPVTITATSETQSATATITVIKPFGLVSVNGHALPTVVTSGLVATGGRFVTYANGRYALRITYQGATQPQIDLGSYTVTGGTYTFTRDVRDTNGNILTFQGTLAGNTLNFVFTGGDSWTFQR